MLSESPGRSDIVSTQLIPTVCRQCLSSASSTVICASLKQPTQWTTDIDGFMIQIKAEGYGEESR